MSEKLNIMTWASVTLPKRRKLKILHGVIKLNEWMRDNYNMSHWLQQREGDLHVNVKFCNLKNPVFLNVTPCHWRYSS